MTTHKDMLQSLPTQGLTEKQPYPKLLVALMYFLAPVSLLTVGAMVYLAINGTPVKMSSQSHDTTVVGKNLPEATLSIVEQRFRTKFMTGDWRYGGIEQDNGIVQAYIQIPQKLDFDRAQQSEYIRRSLCPGGADDLWTTLSPSQLEIHLYTELKSNSVHTLCG